MNSRDDFPLYAAINAKLTEIVESSPAPPDWHDAWMRLRTKTPEEERLHVYQAVRDSGCLPDEAGFHLVVWQIDAMSSEIAASELRELDERMDEIDREQGLEDGRTETGERSEEYDQVLDKYHVAWDRIFLRELAKHGETHAAELYCADPDEFDCRSKTGQAFFHDATEEEMPDWLHDLVAAATACMTVSAPGPAGVRYREEDGFYELMLYPTPVELVGGADDGSMVSPLFSVDLEQLRGVMDRVVDFGWEAHGHPGHDGPHVWLEGSQAGHDVLLRVLAFAPEDEEPGSKMDAT
ncbi:MAG: hypothetical protein N2C14_27660 [Planctomycetales bacterium]